MSGVELVYDYFEDHVRAAALVNERRPVALGVLCFLVSGLSLFVSQALSNRLHVFGFSFTSLALAMLWKVVAGFLLAAIVHVIVDMGGLPGSAASLFVLFGLADLAWALAIPLVLLVRLSSASSWIVSGGYLALGILTLSLKARGVQDNYRMSTGRAWLTLSLPYIAAVALVLIAISLAVVGTIVHLVKLAG